MLSLIIKLLLVLLLTNKASSISRNITLLTLLPYSNPDPAFSPSWEEGDNIRPALELAKDQINKNTSLLPNYTLHLIHADGGCQVTSSTTVGFVKEAFQPGEEPVTGIIGPGCSSATIHLSSLTNKSELSLVHVHGSGSPTLANRTLYQYMLGTLGSSDNFVNGLLYLAREAPWENVAILYDDSRLFYVNTLRSLQAKNTETGKSIDIDFLSSVSSFFIPLRAVQEQGLRITFVLCPLNLTRRILCLAYNRSMVYENYQWVIASHLREELVPPIEFLYGGSEYKCSSNNMVTALEKALLITYRLTPSDDSALISNTTYEDYLTSYAQYREDYNLQLSQGNASYSRWATYLYDAVWAWALVLDNLTKSGGFEIGSEYGNKEQAEMIVEQFYQTRFSGMSGEIAFKESTGYVNRDVNISQVLNNRSVLVAVVGAGNVSLTQFEKIPDSFPVNYRESQTLGIFFATIVFALIIVIAIFHILTIIHHKKPSIKACTPKLLHISYTGAYLVAVGVFLSILNAVIDKDASFRHYFCQLLWAWCLPVGFILLYVPVAMRTWRVYRIFKHYMDPGSLISDPVLIGGTLLAVLVVMVIATTWTALDPFNLEKEVDIRRNVVRVKIICGCQYYSYWIASILSYVVSMLLLVTTFALLTRNIPNKSFTTKSLRVLCYVMALLCLLGFPLYFFLRLEAFNPIYHFTALVVFVNLMLSAFIVCIFVPPLLPVFKHYHCHMEGNKSKLT